MQDTVEVTAIYHSPKDDPSPSVDDRPDFLDHGQGRARVTGVRRGRFVEFEYTLGDSALSIELIMPYLAFREFCIDNEVEILPPDARAKSDYEKLKWRFGGRCKIWSDTSDASATGLPIKEKTS